MKNLNSDENVTTDILASALSATKTTFFKGSGTGYTGDIPAQSALNYGSFIVNVRNTYRYVIGINTEGKVFTNVYGGSAWYGWQELALNSNFIYKRGDTIPIERNYLMGTVLSNARIALFVPVSKPFALGLPSSTITSADITVFDISYEGNARALKNNITQVSGWMRQNGIDMLITFSELPSGLSASTVVGVDFRGNITI